MNLYTGYTERLMSEAKLSRKNFQEAMENNSGSDADMYFFFDHAFKNRTSEYVLNESTRVRHMLLKAGLDSGQ